MDNRYAAMALHTMKRGGDMTSQQIDIINVMCVEYIVPVALLVPSICVESVKGLACMEAEAE